MSSTNRWRKGACHCGRVRFEVLAPDTVTVEDCNCSICRKTGFLHLIVPQDRFRLLAGEEHLTEYRFNTKVAVHRFCRHCGVKAFYTPRSNPDGVSVNVRAFDKDAFDSVIVRPFDGENWEANAASLAQLSKP